jgi:NAD(P)H-dependent flavin oxidoreductase YrpB (nitropropane dioxygenase family)
MPLLQCLAYSLSSPVVVWPLFIVSGCELVVAQSRAGADGRAMASTLVFDADAVDMDTRFIENEEAIADLAYQKVLMDCAAQEIVAAAGAELSIAFGRSC